MPPIHDHGQLQRELGAGLNVTAADAAFVAGRSSIHCRPARCCSAHSRRCPRWSSRAQYPRQRASPSRKSMGKHRRGHGGSALGHRTAQRVARTVLRLSPGRHLRRACIGTFPHLTWVSACVCPTQQACACGALARFDLVPRAASPGLSVSVRAAAPKRCTAGAIARHGRPPCRNTVHFSARGTPAMTGTCCCTSR